jgi:tRNA-specific 2-thiouridylase
MSSLPQISGKIAVGMSGGVDSSVAALLLKREGHDVFGLFMKNWDETDARGVCPAAKDYEDALRVCDRLDIPLYSVEFIREYWDNVFAKCLEDFKAGITPNPDVLCNSEIKFDAFFQKALSLGANFLATGHYCRTEIRDGRAVLLKGLDPDKDQSYFLNAVTESALAQTLFPVGGLIKTEVRDLARKNNIPVSEKKDSTGICFIGVRDFPEFLSRFIKSVPGPFKTLAGEVVGTHMGFQFYTLGQRKGLGLGGQGAAWFVVGKDPATNTVLVERGTDHPALYASSLLANNPSWINEAPVLPISCMAKIRYRQMDQVCRVELLDDSSLKVLFDVPQRAVTPGQSVVFYQGDHCLGGAIIIAHA